VHQLVPVCESVYLEGEPAEQISALARDLGADLIVTASHHPTILARLFNLDGVRGVVELQARSAPLINNVRIAGGNFRSQNHR
jgi:hypothetical protein